MRPPNDPAHPESVTFGRKPASALTGAERQPVGGYVQDTTTVVARCGRHYTGEPRKLGRPETARELAADFDVHRVTYTAAATA